MSSRVADRAGLPNAGSWKELLKARGPPIRPVTGTNLNRDFNGRRDVFLYNYIDDNVSQDPGYVAAPYANHGAHPYMTLLEGNIISRMVVDNTDGRGQGPSRAQCRDNESIGR